jgi:hypothetical protein
MQDRRNPNECDRRLLPRGGRRLTDRPRDVTSRELADAADATTQFIAAECRDGELKGVSYQIGPYWRILRPAAESFLLRRHIPLVRLQYREPYREPLETPEAGEPGEKSPPV